MFMVQILSGLLKLVLLMGEKVKKPAHICRTKAALSNDTKLIPISFQGQTQRSSEPFGWDELRVI